MTCLANNATVNGRILEEAERWLGTPYRHQGSRRGVGCDCLGLIRGIWREIHGAEPEKPGPYAADWAEKGGEDRLTAAARRNLLPVENGTMRPGDLVLFRWRPDFPAKHAGIVAKDERFIHAYQGRGVVSSALVPHWRRRIAGVFAFPPLH